MPSRRQFLGQSLPGITLLAAGGCMTSSHRASNLIIDTHLHLWDLRSQRLPWLTSAPTILNRTYSLDDFSTATRGLNVRAVYMEVDVEETTLDQEADTILDLARPGRSPILAAVLGGRPASPRLGSYLTRLRANPGFKGIRQVLHGSSTPAGYCLQPEFVRGVRHLGTLGLSFDLCMRPRELPDGATLAAACPETRFILDHCGNPDLKSFRSPRTGESPPLHTSDEWKRSIETLAKRSNVICKISGIGAGLVPGAGAEELAPAVNHCLDSFGPDRVVFGGDWPVCLLGITYLRWVEHLREITSARPESDRRKLWHANAARFYGLKV